MQVLVLGGFKAVYLPCGKGSSLGHWPGVWQCPLQYLQKSGKPWHPVSSCLFCVCLWVKSWLPNVELLLKVQLWISVGFLSSSWFNKGVLVAMAVGEVCFTTVWPSSLWLVWLNQTPGLSHTLSKAILHSKHQARQKSSFQSICKICTFFLLQKFQRWGDKNSVPLYGRAKGTRGTKGLSDLGTESKPAECSSVLTACPASERWYWWTCSLENYLQRIVNMPVQANKWWASCLILFSEAQKASASWKHQLQRWC